MMDYLVKEMEKNITFFLTIFLLYLLHFKMK